MRKNLIRLGNDLSKALEKCAEERAALDQVRDLLAKADAKRLAEPDDMRKWNRVLENLEKSLDLTRARFEQSEAHVLRLQSEIARIRGEAPPKAVDEAPPAADAGQGSDWDETMSEVGALNLEQASLLQARIDSGEVHDEQLEAGLALANQMHTAPEPDPDMQVPRRQMALRGAIDKIKRQRFDTMTLDEVKLVLACHALLTSRLEPTSRDQRLRRILDGAIKILQRRKDEMEGR